MAALAAVAAADPTQLSDLNLKSPIALDRSFTALSIFPPKAFATPSEEISISSLFPTTR